MSQIEFSALRQSLSALRSHTNFPHHKSNVSNDKYKITKKYNTYLCQWTLENKITYNKWMPQKDLFPFNHPTVITHNITLLTNYYTKLQHTHYKIILNTHFTQKQNRDTRFIPPPTAILFTQIFINECNPEKDILANKETIQIHNEQTHIYEDTGKYLITITTTKLKWLWQQYNKAKYDHMG